MSERHGPRLHRLAAVVRAVVDPEAAQGAPWAEPLPAAQWRRLRASADRHRVVGMLGHLVVHGRLAVTDAQFDDVAADMERWAGHVLVVEDLAVRATAALEAGGVDVRTAKGVALAHTVYPAPEARVFADVDLFVPAASIDAAVELLGDELGAQRALPELRPGFDHEFAKEVMLETSAGFELDLHRTLVPGAFGLLVPLDELYDHRPTFHLAGRELATFDTVHHAVYSAMSVALADIPVRYSALADLVLLVGQGGDDVAEVIATAHRWGQAIVLQRAVHLVGHHLGVWPSDHPLVTWADRYRPGRREKLLLASNLAAGRTYLRQLAAVAVLDGVGRRGRYLRALVSPSDEYLAARDWRRGSHVTRAWRRLRGR
ncbi:MAG: nucleotidyltransferase family protein [Acidimicrobiales bacterium]